MPPFPFYIILDHSNMIMSYKVCLIKWYISLATVVKFHSSNNLICGYYHCHSAILYQDTLGCGDIPPFIIQKYSSSDKNKA